MDRNSVQWRGYMPAITTPFDALGALDLAALERLIDWLVAEGMHGITLLGTTGEWFSMLPEEKRDVFKTAAARVQGRIPVIGGCNAFTAREAIQTALAAADAGLDGILLTPPPYIMPSEREILNFFETVSDACPLPICVYNWPPGTNLDMSPDLLRRIADVDKVVAFKNSTSNVGAFSEAFFALRNQVRTFGFTSTGLGKAMVQHCGLDGSMGAGALLGREHPQFFEALWAGDEAKADLLLARDVALMRAFYKPTLTAVFGSAQAVCKEALNQMGLPGGYPRAPIMPLKEDEKQYVREVLGSLGKLLPVKSDEWRKYLTADA